jgi:hypothetical protein
LNKKDLILFDALRDLKMKEIQANDSFNQQNVLSRPVRDREELISRGISQIKNELNAENEFIYFVILDKYHVSHSHFYDLSHALLKDLKLFEPNFGN